MNNITRYFDLTESQKLALSSKEMTKAVNIESLERFIENAGSLGLRTPDDLFKEFKKICNECYADLQKIRQRIYDEEVRFRQKASFIGAKQQKSAKPKTEG